MNEIFAHSRFALARKKRCFSQKALAGAIGMTPRMIFSYERGTHEPSPETLSKIAETLKFPKAFFLASEMDEVTADAVSFRAFSRLSAQKRESALATGALATLFSDWMEKNFNLPKTNVPDLRSTDPETAADAVRAVWNLGVAPIKKIIPLLESQGVRVFSLTKEAREVDAFCFWRSETPFMFLNTTKSAERARFDAAHELGHLVLHRHGEPHGRQAETEADQFASAFLIPKASVLASATGFISLSSLIKLKSRWLVSVAALNYRLHSLGVTTEWHYRQLCIEISKKGFHKTEPEGIVHETSQLLGKVFLMLRSEKKNITHVAKELNLYTDDLGALMFGLAIVPLSGERVSFSGNKGASLRLV